MTTPVAKQPSTNAGLDSSAFFTGLSCQKPEILGWSIMLVVLTGVLTWLGYIEAIHLVDGWTGNFFLQHQRPMARGAWFILKGWMVLKYLFLAVSRVAAFYLAFLTAYCLTCPGYVFLSTATEKKYRGGA